jgi:hypothetical protein
MACRHHDGSERPQESLWGDIPVLMLESDIVDISSYNEADARNRINAFIDTLETRKKRGA